FVSETRSLAFTETDPGVGNNGTVSYSIATLGAGQTATFTITVHLDANLAANTQLTNTATAGTNTTDSTPNDHHEVSSLMTQVTAIPPSASVAFGPAGEVIEVVSATGFLTQFDAAGVHPLVGGVRSASVAFGPAGEVLLITMLSGALLQADASGTHLLVGSGVFSASLAFGPSGEVM